MKKIYSFDTTLRDGAQAEKVSFSVADKLKIVKLLDELGVDYIEAGNPASNMKDAELYKEASKLRLKHSRLVAFGSTCRINAKADEDENLARLLGTGAPACAIFGKAWDFHVSQVLRTTGEENIRIITDSIKFLKAAGREVAFDAEHFFDGYKQNRKYAMEVLTAAFEAGADVLVLCDTNGGLFPEETYEITRAVINAFDCPVGIHVHNDGGLAAANSIMAVSAGAVHVQGTINGIGERCGNANLATIIANLQLKKGYRLIPDENMVKLTSISRAIAEISNISLSGLPYVSKNAFAHKAGMHIDGVLKNASSFEHISPEEVGNERTLLVSEIAGKSALLSMLSRIDINVQKGSPKLDIILNRLKELEYQGYQFEGAEASLELEIFRVLGLYKSLFTIERLRTIIEQDSEGHANSSVMIKVSVGDKEELTAADGDGPVHAMDLALRKALEVFYPELKSTRLTDFKVRVLNSDAATGAKVRVLVETTDKSNSWTTVGVSTDVIEASRKALTDAIEYKLLKAVNKNGYDDEPENSCQKGGA